MVWNPPQDFCEFLWTAPPAALCEDCLHFAPTAQTQKPSSLPVSEEYLLTGIILYFLVTLGAVYRHKEGNVASHMSPSFLVSATSFLSFPSFFSLMQPSNSFPSVRQLLPHSGSPSFTLQPKWLIMDSTTRDNFPILTEIPVLILP